jgi:hypothetical protein
MADDEMGDFPELHRLDSNEHSKMSDLIHKFKGTSTLEDKKRVHDAFADIAGPNAITSKPKMTGNPENLTSPPMAKRPTAIRFNTAGLKQRFFGKSSAPAQEGPRQDESYSPKRKSVPAREEEEPRKDAGPSLPFQPGPGALRNFDKELTRNPTRTSIRFNLPGDGEVKRYSLDES